MRVRRPAPFDPATLADLLPAATSVDPEASSEARDQLDRLRIELDALPVEQRRAVLLATMGGRTSAEIGEIEGIPVPTAKTRLRTGLRKLRAAVASEVEP
jgi:DNA-directed RNA polymerase specialized sigma24 family protein